MSCKIGMISLGCPKNQVDAERMLASLKNAGFEITADQMEADAIIVNTCGFIEDAKREAIENILETAELKQSARLKALIVTGCLAERYNQQVLTEMPEVDVVAGIGADGDIVRIVRDALAGKSYCECPPKENLPLEGERLLTTPPHWAYLKISEGCSNRCAYCAIPYIRGNMRSRPMENVVAEARSLAESGVRELILVAQDTTRYGEDLYHESKLPDLLDQLCGIAGIHWIRLLYCYPDRITDRLLDTIAVQPKVLPYIDLPLQHADAAVLRRMNRKGSPEELFALLEKIRARLPEVVIRTTVMTGFPGEGEREFETLSDFVNRAEFDRLGCFAYSPEEGTPAAEFPDQVEETLKKHRGELIMQQQYVIFDRKNRSRIGKTYEVIVDGLDAESGCCIGRTYMDAPEIDGRVLFRCNKTPEPGSFVKVRVTDTDGYDLIGELAEDDTEA
ncbi:MAG TPA: 30S ribosomal protein S12 methylthiotransferase RimO [Candidatus Onthovicinus excrementipullorum]|nr:30S ribosomal protein S12 methylthiotransferase RimO [Candidatus Onthovicinus excrementipullorum]